MATTTRTPDSTNQGQGANMYGVYDRSGRGGTAFYQSAWFWGVVLLAILVVLFMWMRSST